LYTEKYGRSKQANSVEDVEDRLPGLSRRTVELAVGAKPSDLY
jgi:hypothetical protein